MKTQNTTFITLMLATAFFYLLPANKLQASEPLLTNNVSVAPARCVALHQGQICYQKITISWQTIQANDYCLLIKDNETPLQCWQKSSQGNYIYEFSGDTAQIIQLVNTQNQQLISEVKIELAWVYKSNTRRKTHWRLL